MPAPGTMPKAKCGLSWNTVSGVAIMMSARSAYSEWTVVGPLSAAMTGTGMSIRFSRTFLPSRGILSYPRGE